MLILRFTVANIMMVNHQLLVKLTDFGLSFSSLGAKFLGKVELINISNNNDNNSLQPVQAQVSWPFIFCLRSWKVEKI